MRKIHKFLSVLLAIMMVMSIIPITVSATDTSGTCGDNLTWSYDETTYTLTISGEGDMYDYEADTDPTDGVNTDNRPWINFVHKIKSVIIADGVTSIGDDAFYKCFNITSAIIPDSITSIGNCAFYYCEDLESASIPDGVTYIGDYAFYFCAKLEDIVIPSSVETIGRYAFSICDSIESITIPENVSSIGDCAFHHCANLVSITVDENNKHYSSDEYGVLFDKEKTTLIQYPENNRTKDYSIPDGVETIGTLAFYWCEYLKNVIIPDSVITIEKSAFNNCHNIERVVIGSGVTTIGELAFYECNYLETIVMGKGVTTIAAKAFYDCESIAVVYYGGTKGNWNSIEVGKYNSALLDAEIIYNHNYHDSTVSGNCGDDLTWVYNMNTHTITVSGTGAMEDYKYFDSRPWEYFEEEIESIVINEGVTTVGAKTFHSLDNLTRVSLPESLISIGNSAFNECVNLSAITITENVTTIGEHAFYSCASLKSIIIPDKVTTIGWNAFNNCDSLESVVLGECLITIGTSAFASCDNLKEIIIPASVTTISAGAFNNCASLTNITVDDNNQYYSSDEYGVWFNKDKTTLILSPRANERTSYIIPDSVTTICNNAFDNNKNLEDVTIPYGVLIIGINSFHNCTNLKNVTIPESVTTIDEYAFSHCDSFTSVVIPESVTTLGDGAFYSCDALETIMIPGSIASIGDNTFSYCASLVNVTIGNGITELGMYMFEGCTSLAYVRLPDSITKLRSGMFSGCTSLESIIIPDGITLIGYGCFDECSNLTDVYYLGIEDEWSKVNIYNNNDPLSSAIIHCLGVICIKGDYVYKNNVRLNAYQLVKVDGDFYYISNYHKIVKDKTVYLSAERVEGFTYADGTPLKAGHYAFGEDGKMIMLNGVVDDYLYKNNVRMDAYQLVEYEGNFYYIGNYHKIIRDKVHYLSAERVEGFTYADGTPLKAGNYTFDANGKMVILNGVVGDYFYKNNTRLDAYQLVEHEGDIYFISNYHKIVRDKTVYLSAERVEGFTNADGTPLKAGYYTFDADGKMVILNGIVNDYFYKNNVRLDAYQLVEHEGNIYFISNYHKIVRDKTVYLSAQRVEGFTNADGTPLKAGYYTFDADGKIVIS